jgi:hypothetical protein
MKALCKLNKSETSAALLRLAKESHQTRFICKKCARLSKHKKELCKPITIDKLTAERSEES